MTIRQIAARRSRAALIGALETCTCDYPNTRASTPTEHALWCGAHRMLCTDAERAALPPSYQWQPAGGGVRGRCPTCNGEETAIGMDALAAKMAELHQHRAP